MNNFPLHVFSPRELANMLKDKDILSISFLSISALSFIAYSILLVLRPEKHSWPLIPCLFFFFSFYFHRGYFIWKKNHELTSIQKGGNTKRIVNFFKNTKILISLIISIILLVGLSIYIGWPRYRVYASFESTYEKYKAKLGKPIREVVKGSDLYEAEYEHAIVIWIQNLSKFHFLDKRNFEWKAYPEPAWVPASDPKYRNKEWLEKRFKPSKGLYPPYTGVAKLWDEDEKNVKWIGYRKWHCFYEGHHQEFERGIIVGNFLRSPDNIDVQVIFVLTSDFRWDSEEPKVREAVRCKKPPE